MNSSLRKLGLWSVPLLAAVFFVYAACLWAAAGRTAVVPPTRTIRPLALSGGTPTAAAPALPPLGRLFFADAPVASSPAAAVATYKSELILCGITTGLKDTAFLAPAGSPSQTKQVTVGENYLGETVVAIGENSVTLSKDGKQTILFLQ